MTGSEPVALPLGYIPTSKYYITSNAKEMQALFEKNCKKAKKLFLVQLS